MLTTSQRRIEEPLNAQPRLRTTSRVASVDVLRGIVIAGMILVNNPGDGHHVYWPLEHATWNGWTPTDLIFPFFIFIVGVSIMLSFESRVSRGAKKHDLTLHSLRRSFIIFVLGLFLYAYPRFDLHTMRILGVLQRIALVYIATSALVLYANRKIRILTILGILLGYWMLMVCTPVPGYGSGVLTMDGSLASYVDRSFMYNHLYYAHRFDPEGLLSTIPAVASCLLGVLAGEWIQTLNNKRLLVNLIFASVVCIIAGLLWSLLFPINKQLWTSSFVLLTTGIAMAILAALYFIIDIREYCGWEKPFTYLGANPLAIYFGAEFLSAVLTRHTVSGNRLKDLAYNRFFLHLFSSPYLNSLAYAVAYVSLFGGIAWFLYRRKVYLRV